MQDSVWSGPVLAGALIASASLLVVLSTQVEVTPPREPEVVVESACSSSDVAGLRNEISRLTRARLIDTLDGDSSDAERWRRDSIRRMRAALVDCDWRAATDIDVCSGFDLQEAQAEIDWRQRTRTDFARYRFITTDSTALEIMTGMCAISGARTWPRPANRSRYHHTYDSLRML